ncbi:hypothetical protein IEO21_06341 [Rhodonia placenta]|uniref:DUF6533 domain-containing protein n=1 Tax=Rhodonia placenta TaxID=104341 RepID=A0A8H7P0H7_9APHY|nr:hypothetical protein IEO21_06341 [Postia placenta]
MSTALIAEIKQDYVENCLYFAATCLCCYDYFLTLQQEIDFIWSGRLTFANILFYCFRYPAILNTIFVVLGYVPWPGWQTTRGWRCLDIDKLCTCVYILLDYPIQNTGWLPAKLVFTAMRVYALSGRSKILFGIVLTLGLVAPVISTYTFAVSYPILQVVTPTYQSCDIYARYTVNKVHSNIVRWAWTLAGMIGTRVSSLLFDGLVMALTWVRIRRIAVPSSDAAASKSLQAVLIKDSTYVLRSNISYNATNGGASLLKLYQHGRRLLDLREVTATFGESKTTSISQTVSSLKFIVSSTSPEDILMDEFLTYDSVTAGSSHLQDDLTVHSTG